MSIPGFVFYLTSGILLASSVMVISARNPVHSVLYLILAFFQAAGLFILLGAEFIGMILVIVYVGAVAVLFLFVVMMLDINFTELRQGFLSYLPVGLLIGFVLLGELVLIGGAWQFVDGAVGRGVAPIPPADQVTNAQALGRVIYTQYIYPFQGTGIILLIAMIGAIVLTLQHRQDVRRQDIGDQVARRREDAVVLRKVPTGGGA
ncbi:NADH-quinone oxidoreductase subunit J [uncultured Gammaproteobacteria bacterium]